MTIRYLLLLTIFAATAPLQAQTGVAGAHQKHNLLDRENGTVSVAVSGAWPVQQAMSEVRREYGLVLDYEEGSSEDPNRVAGRGPNRRWIGGNYAFRVAEPTLTVFSSKAQFIDSLLAQFRAQGSRNFTVIPGADSRLTVSPSLESERILDTPIVVKREKRTIGETITAILAEVSKSRSISLERGGIVDPELNHTAVEVGNTLPIAARTLLARALDGASYRKVWILTWEPSDGNYYIGIETAVKLETDSTGQVRAMPVR